ncbi:hypothetical protein L2E82_47548 [Cichorium intybus]|uniref:Uncharacterized protein n=1 Tax=Cichorium intybus TaxID=13427 RepID=A0ACB8YVX5_CICIN|nr:hypothetical protein L2E82_47548 [Cichorium intybus]
MYFLLLYPKVRTRLLSIGDSGISELAGLDVDEKMASQKIEEDRILEIVEKDLTEFAPVDTPAAVNAFLEYWKPYALVLVENELWPNLVFTASANGVSHIERKNSHG